MGRFDYNHQLELLESTAEFGKVYRNLYQAFEEGSANVLSLISRGKISFARQELNDLFLKNLDFVTILSRLSIIRKDPNIDFKALFDSRVDFGNFLINLESRYFLNYL